MKKPQATFAGSLAAFELVLRDDEAHLKQTQHDMRSTRRTKAIVVRKIMRMVGGERFAVASSGVACVGDGGDGG